MNTSIDIQIINSIKTLQKSVENIQNKYNNFYIEKEKKILSNERLNLKLEKLLKIQLDKNFS